MSRLCILKTNGKGKVPKSLKPNAFSLSFQQTIKDLLLSELNRGIRNNTG